MGASQYRLLGLVLVLRLVAPPAVDAAVPARAAAAAVRRVNRHGPLLGVVVPNAFEMAPLLRSPSFAPAMELPACLDLAGRRFRFGMIGKEKVVVVMTGLGMLNAGVGTQLLLDLFEIKGIVHFGIAGNANPSLRIGDVTIPHYWAHTGLWYWQSYGDGPPDELALESSGGFTRKYGYLNISDYSVGVHNGSSNSLNSVWYQAEEVFPADGTPEVPLHALWVPVDRRYYSLAHKLEGMKLRRCINATCLRRSPAVVQVHRGCSANVFLDNAAYRQFLHSKFDATAVDMETAAVALVALQQRVPFIAIRSLSDFAGGGSAKSNEANIFAPFAAQNAAEVAVKFISLLS